MNVIPPISITDSTLTYSSVSEPDTGEVTWVSGSFTAGDVRILTSTHRKYQCLVTGTHTGSPSVDTTNWFDIGPTNKWAMFDTLRNSATTTSGSTIIVDIEPGVRIDSIAALQVANCYSIEINILTPGLVNVYNRTAYLQLDFSNWYDYFYGEMLSIPNTVLFDIPPYTNNTISITFTGSSVSCGALIIGKYVNIGAIQYSATNDVLNFSSVDRDIYGNATMVQRRNVPKTRQNLFLEPAKVDRIKKLREELNAIPAVWCGLEDDTNKYFNSFIILGFYKDMSMSIESPINVMLSLELEEV